MVVVGRQPGCLGCCEEEEEEEEEGGPVWQGAAAIALGGHTRAGGERRARRMTLGR